MFAKIIVILGPTSSGKSKLAIKIAKKYSAYGGGEIISADSRQVYKELNIGSGKITKKEMKGIPHHLIGIASPRKIFTVSQYQKLAKKILKNIIERGKLPIICGGAGLYIDALIYNCQFPNVPPQPKLRKKLEKFTTEELFKQLQKLDQRRVKNIDKYNRHRLIRALEIVISTGKPVPSLKQNAILSDSTIPSDSDNIISPYDILKIGINPPKEKLQEKIEKRIKQMLRNGLLNEIKNLRKQKLSWNRIYSFGFEYKYPAFYLQNKINKKEMMDKIIKENWRYAKRQLTWFKRDQKINWIINEKVTNKLVKKFIEN